jgi:Ni/Fe-hydrogenase 1 B-type cytochrome subunit
MSAGEASSGYWFGKLRFAHFVTGYVFLANFLFRLYWSLAGNKYANWRNFFPISKRKLHEVKAVIKVDVLQSSDEPVHTLGHNAVAYLTYMGTGLLTVFQVITGFALYASMSDAWFPHLFDWVVPLFGSEQNLRIFHYAVLWLFAVFMLIHVYLVFYHDYVEGHGVLSSIVGGWKFMEKEQIEAESATGISWLPRRRGKNSKSAPPAVMSPKE